MKTIDEILEKHYKSDVANLDYPDYVKEALVEYIEQLIDEINGIKSNKYSNVTFTYDNKEFIVKLNKEEILKLVHQSINKHDNT